MLRFATKPDNVFNEILNNALEMVIDQIENDIEADDEDGFIFLYFEEEFVKSFGGVHDGIPIILNELKKIEKAHHSNDIYIPTDIHFKMLDRILDTYCDLYNDEFHLHEESTVKCNGETLHALSYDAIIDTFFWDRDYDFDALTASGLLQDKQLRERFDSTLSIQALNTAIGIPVDFSDLKMEKWEGEDWSDNFDYSEFWLNENDL